MGELEKGVFVFREEIQSVACSDEPNEGRDVHSVKPRERAKAQRNIRWMNKFRWERIEVRRKLLVSER